MGVSNCIVVALPESNTVLFMEIESLERQLEEIQVENFNIKQMKDLFEQKAAQLATEIVGKYINTRSDSVLYLCNLCKWSFIQLPFIRS